jgi:hypothetical protein
MEAIEKHRDYDENSAEIKALRANEYPKLFEKFHEKALEKAFKDEGVRAQ